MGNNDRQIMAAMRSFVAAFWAMVICLWASFLFSAVFVIYWWIRMMNAEAALTRSVQEAQAEFQKQMEAIDDAQNRSRR